MQLCVKFKLMNDPHVHIMLQLMLANEYRYLIDDKIYNSRPLLIVKKIFGHQTLQTVLSLSLPRGEL